MSRKGIFLGILTATVLATAAVAVTPVDAISKRQANFKGIGRSFKAINDEVRKPAPDMAIIRVNSAALQKALAANGGLFPKGSGPEAMVKTGAKSDIWTNWNGFRAAYGKALNTTDALVRSAQGGNIGAVKASMPAVGAACKSCHDQFRARD